MESVLHIEQIMRRTPAPLSVGHTDYIFYGDRDLGEDDDPLGTPAGSMRLGCPLEEVDHGSTRSHVPFVKTFEYMPDFHRPSGHVYIETVHYFKDMKYLIPVRTKIHSGFSQGLRVTHLPSLNFVREDLGGLGRRVTDPRSDIISDLITNDAYFERNYRSPAVDWVKDELAHILSRSNVTDIQFDSERLAHMIYRFKHQVRATPHDVSSYHLKELLNTVSLENESFPTDYLSNDVIVHPVLDVKRRLVHNNLDLKGRGRLPVERLPRIDYNPFAFQGILGLLDQLPLTDFNVDVIVQCDNSISFVHDHIAVNRLAVFEDNDLGAFSSETLMQDIINEETLKTIIRSFVKYHSAMSDSLVEMINREPVKLKIIKTIGDEALILLYKHNSTDRDDPLCGVYFDIALQSLAPLTIIPEINLS